MRRILSGILILSVLSSVLFAQNQSKNLIGFSNENSSKQTDLEGKFDSFLKRENLREWMKRLSARPHHVGSPSGKENAEFMLSLFKSWGYEAQIEQFDILFPTPKTRVLEMLAPETFTAKLVEPALKEDLETNKFCRPNTRKICGRNR